MGQAKSKGAAGGGGEGGLSSPARSPKRSASSLSSSSKRGSKVSKSSLHQEDSPGGGAGDVGRVQDVEKDVERHVVYDLEASPGGKRTSPHAKAKGKKKSGSLLSKLKSPKKSAVHEATMTASMASPENETGVKMEETPVKLVEGLGGMGSPAPPTTPPLGDRLAGGPGGDPMTPLNIDTSVSSHHPRATSTPAANGVVGNGMPPLSPASTTDQSDDEAFTPTEQQSSLRSPSPTFSYASISTNASSTRRALRNGEMAVRQSEPNFGRFYTASYLEGNKAGYLRRSTTDKDKERSKSPHTNFHRPANFSYSKEPPEFLKKKGSGMSALATGKRVVKVRRSSSPGLHKNDEAIKMSMMPGGQPKAPNEPDKIERDDWPGLASPAAILPQILRERRRSRGDAKDDEEEPVAEDPRIQREIDEISKIKDESGIGKVIFQELAELKKKPAKPVDPWKASRVPSAKYEPRYHTRYQSPMFASPSRFIDVTRRSWDDHDIRGYRSVSTLANLPTARPGYGPAYSAPRAATLPVSGMYGGRDMLYFGFRDESGESEHNLRSNYTSNSTLTGDSLSTRGRSGYSSSVAAYDVPSIPLLKLQKSTWHTECDPPVYDYEKLKITNFDLPRDVDRNKLEIHLNDQDFGNLFNVSRDKFYRMAEWKRNDMKKKLDLY